MALILSRHIDEGVMIGDDMEIFIAEIRGDKVRLGFRGKAPVHRREVWEAIQRDKQQEPTDANR